MKTTHVRRHSRRFAGAILVTLVGTAVLSGCISTKVVGENEPDPNGDSHREVVVQTGDGAACSFPSSALSECSSDDERAVSTLKERLCNPNELTALTGTEWRLSAGSWHRIYEGVPLTLRFGVDGRSFFEVGTPVAPVADDGYLCAELPDQEPCYKSSFYPFYVGSTFPLHGVHPIDTGWTLSFRPEGYLDEWCGLQVPRRDEPDKCWFSIFGNHGGTVSPVCALVDMNEDGESVYHEPRDCGWIDRAVHWWACNCTSAFCYASDWSEAQDWTLQLNAEGTELTLTVNGEAHTFSRVGG